MNIISRVNSLGRKITPFFIVSVFVLSSALLFSNATTAPAAVNPPVSPVRGVSMYLPNMPACDGGFGTMDTTASSSISVFGAGYHYSNNPYHWRWAGGARPIAGDRLDWYWINIPSPRYGIWDLGKLTTKVRVYPSVIPYGPVLLERIHAYTVSVSADGVNNWTVLNPTATYINDPQNIQAHDGVKDFQFATPFKYVKITSNFNHYTSIDAVQECSGSTVTPPPSTGQCSTDSQCGTNGLTGAAFCQSGNVYRNFRTFTCQNPGTSSSQCTSNDNAQLQQTCTAGCSNGACITSSSQCNTNADCGAGKVCVNNQCQNQLTVSCSASPNPTTTGNLVTFTAQAAGGTGTFNYTWTGACSGFSNTCATIFGSAGTPTAFLTVTSGNQTVPTSCSVTVNPPSGTCLTDANCPSGQRCLNGTCIVPQCSANSDCPSGQICSQGRCIANPFPPTVETRPATDILANSATLRGILNSLGSDASSSVWFQWGTTTAYGFETPHVTMTSASPFSAAISSLTPGTVYHFRAVAQNGQGTVYGQDMSFVAGNSILNPQVQSLPPTNITPTSVLLNGQLLSLGGDNSAQVYFLWGPTVAYGNETTHQTINSAGPFSQTVGGLTPGTVYHLKACAQNSAGTVCGSDMTFSTTNTQNPGGCTTNAQCGAGQTCVGGTCQLALAVTCNAVPNPAFVGDAVTFSAVPTGGVGTYSYAWTGACNGFASNCSTHFGSPGTPTAFLTVTSGTQTATTSCSVSVGQNTQNNPQCTDNAYRQCVGNTSYWFNSCGQQGSVASHCTGNQYCSNGACITNPPYNPYPPYPPYPPPICNYLGCPGYPQQPSQGNLQITKGARNVSAGGFGWSSSINAHPSDILQFQITIQNHTSQVANNVMVTDNLPSQLYYQNVLTTDGSVPYYGNITHGLNIGSIAPGQTKVITFQAQVGPSHAFNFGSTTLTNTATVTFDHGSQSATSTVTVTKTGVYGATSVSTGLTNSLFKDSFFIPLLAVLFAGWLFRSRIFNILDMAFAFNRSHFTIEGKLARKIEAAKRADQI